MSVINEETNPRKPVLFNDQKPFGLKFLQAPEDASVPPLNNASVKLGATPTPNDTHGDAYSD